jgi:D-alanyl-D-alanine carboxypeptidase
MFGKKHLGFNLLGLVSAAFLIFQINGCGDKKMPEKVEKTMVDSELSAELQSILEKYRESWNIKGVSAALTLPGNRIWLGASGLSSETDSVTTDMLFGVGSVTKSYIAALILKYVEEGKLSLDSRIGTWIYNDNTNGDASIRNLLDHTSGINNYMNHKDYNTALIKYPDTVWTADELMKSFLSYPTFQPGGGWGYSATNYILLGKIIEEISGNSVAYELREKILNPLGLTNTFLYPDEIYPAEKMAHLWFVVDTTGVPVDVNELVSPPPLRGLFSSVWTAGAINATAEDAVKWFDALFNNRVLSDTLFKEMTIPSKNSGRFKYGLGVMYTTINQKTAIGHSGGIGYSSFVYYIPEDSVGIALLANSQTGLIQLAANLHEACIEPEGVESE